MGLNRRAAVIGLLGGVLLLVNSCASDVTSDLDKAFEDAASDSVAPSLRLHHQQVLLQFLRLRLALGHGQCGGDGLLPAELLLHTLQHLVLLDLRDLDNQSLPFLGVGVCQQRLRVQVCLRLVQGRSKERLLSQLRLCLLLLLQQKLLLSSVSTNRGEIRAAIVRIVQRLSLQTSLGITTVILNGPLGRTVFSPQHRSKKMKTAISLPDSLFEATNALAEWLGIPAPSSTTSAVSEISCRDEFFYTQNQINFIHYSYAYLQEDISCGNREHLQALHHLMGCPATSYGEFASVLRGHHRGIFQLSDQNETMAASNTASGQATQEGH